MNSPENRYLCFWNNASADITAKTSFEAQKKAEKAFQKTYGKKVKRYQITVKLAQKNGEPVIHLPLD